MYQIDVQSIQVRLAMARLWLAKADTDTAATRHAWEQLVHEFDDLAFRIAGPTGDDLASDLAFAYFECQRLAQRSCCREDFVRRLGTLGWQLTDAISADNAETLSAFYAQMDWPNGERDFWDPR
jgi:hypothetical protein